MMQEELIKEIVKQFFKQNPFDNDVMVNVGINTKENSLTVNLASSEKSYVTITPRQYCNILILHGLIYDKESDYIYQTNISAKCDPIEGGYLSFDLEYDPKTLDKFVESFNN